jgi:hypothetical protein
MMPQTSLKRLVSETVTDNETIQPQEADENDDPYE